MSDGANQCKMRALVCVEHSITARERERGGGGGEGGWEGVKRERGRETETKTDRQRQKQTYRQPCRDRQTELVISV